MAINKPTQVGGRIDHENTGFRHNTALTHLDRQCSSPFSTPMITLVVGGPKSPAKEFKPQKFFIHEILLVEQSLVFQTMLGYNYRRGDDVYRECGRNYFAWNDAQHNVLTLPEDRVADWSMLLHWFYSDTNIFEYTIKSVPSNCLTTNTVETQSEQNLLNAIIRDQPGLHNDALYSSLTDCLARKSCGQKDWKSTEVRANPSNQPREERKTSLKEDPPKGTQDLTASNDLPNLQVLPCVHPLLNDTQLPTLGHLIRLYILADRYMIVGHQTSNSMFTLKSQIALRLQAIHKLIRIVPNNEDVERIWENIPVPAVEDPLKSVVLESYASMNNRSFERVFGVGSDCKRRIAEDWHPEFLYDLLCMKVKNKARKKKQLSSAGVRAIDERS